MESVAVVQNTPGSDEGLLNPQAIIRVVKKRKWPILVTAAVVLLLTAIAYSMIQPQYNAISRVALDRRTDPVVSTGSTPTPLSTDSSTVDTEVQVLRSPAVAAAIVDKLNLAKVEGFGFTSDGATPANLRRNRAANVVQNGLQVKRDGTSYSISVSYVADDPALAANIVNAAADAYINGQKAGEAANRNQQIAVLNERLGQVRADVINAETAAARYRGTTNLMDFSRDGAAAQSAMLSLDNQLAQARADQASADARAAVAGGSAGAALPAVLQSPAVHELRSQQARLETQRAELSERYGNLHPSIASIDEQLAATNRALDSEISRVRQGVGAEAAIARSRTASLQGSIGAQRGMLLSANNASVHLAELDRNADAAKTLYLALLDRYKQAVAAQGSEQSNAYVIAYAQPSNAPVSPNKTAFIIGGILAAMIAAALVALLFEAWDDGYFKEAEVDGNGRVRSVA
jgi:uncharacterized protein involved in exopolysaccharide biosynthesis